jgi:hypothetical protein
VLASLLMSSSSAMADENFHLFRPDAAFVQVGHPEDGSDTWSANVGLSYNWPALAKMVDVDWLTTSGEITVGYWQTQNLPPDRHRTSTQVGFTPVWRWYPEGKSGWFAEAGIGANLITPIYTTPHKRFSTEFNFGDHVGAGWRGSRPGDGEWALRFQHFSNAGLGEPNPGINFLQLRYLHPL